MATYTKKGSNIIVSELSKNEIMALLKANIACKMIFSLNNTVMDTIELSERFYKGNLNFVIGSENGKSQVFKYDKLIEIIAEKLSVCLLTVEVEATEFDKKEPLFFMLDKIKPVIIETCVYFDYQDSVYSIINRPINNVSNKLYYFELNNSVLLFSESGPKLIYGKFADVEEVFC